MTLPISIRMPLPAIVACILITGCSEQAPIVAYVVKSENEQDFTSDVLRRNFPPIPFRWAIPKSWSIAANDQFSQRAWNVGPPTESARITLGRFPAGAGVESQVARWRRQLELPAEDDPMKNVETLQTKNREASYASLVGTEETILALIVPIDSNMWILRFRGPNSVTRLTGDQFREFCQSLEYVAPVSGPSSSPAAASEDSSATGSTAPGRASPNKTTSAAEDSTSEKSAPDSAADTTETTDSTATPNEPDVSSPETPQSDDEEAAPAAPSQSEGDE